MRRGGFTLVETLVAMLLTTMLVLAVFGGLSFVGRGYRRDELAMARAQVAQSVSEQLADDLRHQFGVAVPTARALLLNGYEGSPSTFITEPRRGAHQVATYTSGRKSRDAIVRAEYSEAAVPQGAGWVPQPTTSRYVQKMALAAPPPPWGAASTAFLVPLPYGDDPDVVHLAVSTRRASQGDQVLWSFWRRRRGRFDGGQVLRSDSAGMRSFTFEASLVASVALYYDWVRLVKAKDVALAPLEQFVELDFREPGELKLPFVEPQFRVHRVFAAGL